MNTGTRLSIPILAALILSTPLSAQPSQETIVFLHGMIRTRASMTVIAKRFKDSGYATLNFPYSQKEAPLSDISDSLAAFLEENVHTPRYHLVAHSLGNIIIRNALRKPLKPGLGRIVMLAPPNHPVPLAKLLKENPIFKWVTQDSGQKLSEEKFYKTLPVPKAEFGIIAGSAGNKLTSKKVNDGILDVDIAKLDGMKDFVTVHHTHSVIMYGKDTFSLTKRFIETGAFK